MWNNLDSDSDEDVQPKSAFPQVAQPVQPQSKPVDGVGGANPRPMIPVGQGHGHGGAGLDEGGGSGGQNPKAMMPVGQGQAGEGQVEGGEEDDEITRLLNDETGRATKCEDKRSNGMCTVIIVDTSAGMAGEPLYEAGHFINEFLNGVEEVQFEFGVNENVAIVSVGATMQVIQHLTSDISTVRRAVDSLFPDGPNQLAVGVVLALACLVEKPKQDYVFVTNRHNVLPRVIVLTNGHVGGDQGGGQVPGLQEKAFGAKNTAAEYVQRVKKRTLARFDCVPVGPRPDMAFLETVSGVTGGKVMQPTDANKMSREMLHHHIVGLVKRSARNQNDPNIVTEIANQFMKSEICQDDLDSVMEWIRKGEPSMSSREEYKRRQELQQWQQQQQQQQQMRDRGEGRRMRIPMMGGGGMGGMGGMGGGMDLPGLMGMMGGGGMGQMARGMGGMGGMDVPHVVKTATRPMPKLAPGKSAPKLPILPGITAPTHGERANQRLRGMMGGMMGGMMEGGMADMHGD